MRFIATYILILLVAVQSTSSWFLVMAFHLNRDYIAKNLCVNRSKPVISCGGKCFLVKTLKEKEENDSSKQALNIETVSLVLSSKSFFCNDIPPVHSLQVLPIADHRFDKTTDRSRPFFQPPRA